MNWFERYGVVGAYFIIINSVWVFFNNTMLTEFKSFAFSHNGIATLTVGFLGLLILPLGYIFSILGQLAYYRSLLGKQVHKECFFKLKEDSRVKEEMNISVADAQSEEIVENKMSAYVRLNLNADRIKHLREFTSKRFDVMSINGSIIVASLVTLLVNMAVKIYSDKAIFILSPAEKFVLLLMLFLFVVLINSNEIMKDAVISVNLDILNHIESLPSTKAKKNIQW